jgi:two-component system LytT family sensor kinase
MTLARAKWLLLLIVPAVLGLMDASQVQYDRAVRGDPITWGHALTHGLPRWYTWALLTPLILTLAARLSRARFGLTPTLAVHALAAAGFTLVQISLFALASNWLHGAASPFAYFQTAFFKYIGLTFFSGVVTYAVLASGWYAWEFFRRYRDRERAAGALAAQTSQLKALLAEARLQQLQSKLQPHFLFNTLHAFSGLVMRGEKKHAVRMTARLSELLRRSLQVAERPEIPLEEELRLLEDYLAIQQLRFGDRLRISVRVAAETRGALVPTLLLQPLVENAIRHGIEADPEAGRIEVETRRIADRLVITVRDDGPGFPEDVDGDAEGVGMRNTRVRLSTLYGADAHLDRRNRRGGGAEVDVSIPFHRAPVLTTDPKASTESASRKAV